MLSEKRGKRGQGGQDGEGKRGWTYNHYCHCHSVHISSKKCRKCDIKKEIINEEVGIERETREGRSTYIHRVGG